jgi:hypothetical protein
LFWDGVGGDGEIGERFWGKSAGSGSEMLNECFIFWKSSGSMYSVSVE